MGDVVGVEEVDRNKDPHIKDLDSAIKNFMQTAKDSYAGAKKPSNYSSKDEGGQTLKDLYKVWAKSWLEKWSKKM